MEEYKLSFPHCFTINLPSKLQMTLFTASITFSLVILFLISELKMETIHHYAPLKKRLIVFFVMRSFISQQSTVDKEAETVVE